MNRSSEGIRRTSLYPMRPGCLSECAADNVARHAIQHLGSDEVMHGDARRAALHPRTPAIPRVLMRIPRRICRRICRCSAGYVSTTLTYTSQRHVGTFHARIVKQDLVLRVVTPAQHTHLSFERIDKCEAQRKEPRRHFCIASTCMLCKGGLLAAGGGDA